MGRVKRIVRRTQLKTDTLGEFILVQAGKVKSKQAVPHEERKSVRAKKRKATRKMKQAQRK